MYKYWLKFCNFYLTVVLIIIVSTIVISGTLEVYRAGGIKGVVVLAAVSVFMAAIYTICVDEDRRNPRGLD